MRAVRQGGHACGKETDAPLSSPGCPCRPSLFHHIMQLGAASEKGAACMPRMAGRRVWNLGGRQDEPNVIR